MLSKNYVTSVTYETYILAKPIIDRITTKIILLWSIDKNNERTAAAKD